MKDCRDIIIIVNKIIGQLHIIIVIPVDVAALMAEDLSSKYW